MGEVSDLWETFDALHMVIEIDLWVYGVSEAQGP